MRQLVSLGLALAVGAWASIALAAEHRVALLGGDDELMRQLSLALNAWEVETMALNVEPPVALQPHALARASELSRELRLVGVVWVTETPDGSLLWVYDAPSGEVTTRAVSERAPFSSATAAGLALSVKTTLRASVEPPASAATPPLPEPPPPPAPSPAREPSPTPPSRETSSPSRAQLLLAVDGQAVRAATLRAAYSIQGVFWGAAARRLGLGLRFGMSSPRPFETESVRGHVRDIALGPSLELRWIATRRVQGQLLLAGVLHATALDGTLTLDGANVTSKRYDVAAALGGKASLRLPHGALLGLQLGVEYFLRYPRYLVEGTPVFSPRPWVPSGGAHVGFEL